MIMTHKIKIRDIYYRHKTEVEEKYKIIEKQIKYIKCTFTREMNIRLEQKKLFCSDTIIFLYIDI